jgi:hypothetical protein
MENNDGLILDQALRILYLENASHMTDDQIEIELARMQRIPSVEMSNELRDKLFSKLSQTLASKSLGQVISEKVSELQINLTELSRVSKLPEDMLKGLQEDEIYTNNIPIVLLRDLLKRLQITFQEAEKSILKTFEILQSKLIDHKMPASPYPSYRRGIYVSKDSSSLLGKKRSEGKELFENKDALEKYLGRLHELMN